jgi:hypothetical protein
VKKNLFQLHLLLLAALFAVIPSLLSSDQTVEAFTCQLQKSLEGRDLPAYLGSFSPEVREEERIALASYFERAGMESVKSRRAGQRTEESGESTVFLQVLFENAFSAMVEVWQLHLRPVDGRLEIRKREVSGSIHSLYKVQLPSEETERVQSVEINHADFRLAFEDALVFHDNIPGLETALLIFGKGRVRFTPSDPIERHQLQIAYKSPSLEDHVPYAYIRCSDSFFQTNVVIKKREGGPARPASQDEKDKASALFAKSYPRSFTIQNSMTGEYLSFLPQGDEASFDFKGERTGELTYIYYPYSEEQVNLFDRSRDRIVNLYSPRKEGDPEDRKLFISMGEQFDVQSCEIDLDYNPAKFYLSAKARIQITALTESLDGLKLRFSPDLEILRICDEEKRELFYTTDKLRKFLYVYFVQPPAQRRPTWIEVYYRGKLVPVPPTTDVAGQSSVGENRYVFQPRYETYFYTHSAYWYPGPADDDYFTSRLKIIVPPEYQCVSNGELVERGRLKDMEEVQEIEKMGSFTYTFKTKAPLKYMSFIVGKFTTLGEGNDPLPLQSLSSSDIMVQKKAFFDEARDVLESFTGWFGPFPFEKLSVVQRLWPQSGGHSPASFVVLNELPWLGEQAFPMNMNSPVDLSRWREYFLAHEIAHQWWGQGVTAGTYRDQWLSEGMAQFAAALYLRKRYGEEAYAAILKRFSQWTGKKSHMGPISLGSRLSFFDFDAYQAIIYDKSALALNMLRDILGDEAFFQGLRDFYGTYKFGAARTGQFRNIMEKVSGRDLEGFFQGWFFSYELPEVRVTTMEEKIGEEGVLLVRVVQGKGLFVFPLWIEWQSGGKVFREKVVVDAPKQEFRLKLSGKPSRIRVNPDKSVPGKFA